MKTQSRAFHYYLFMQSSVWTGMMQTKALEVVYAEFALGCYTCYMLLVVIMDKSIASQGLQLLCVSLYALYMHQSLGDIVKMQILVSGVRDFGIQVSNVLCSGTVLGTESD